MSRSTQTLNRARAAAFDFDVVTDVSPRPVRKPAAAPEPGSQQQDSARETPKTAEA